MKPYLSNFIVVTSKTADKYVLPHLIQAKAA